MVGGVTGRSALAVFSASPRNPKEPAYYPYNPGAVLVVTLAPAKTPRGRRLLGADGMEVEATEAGTIGVEIGGARARLAVMWIPDFTGEESDLEIYFRDQTNGAGTYPAGRFVTLEPMGGNRYRLDFNKARNPFCAYSTVYACPVPWRGNAVAAPIRAGEKYAGGGLTPPEFRDPR
jgi:uncharacterized protein (DUF1684 family)